MAVHNAEKYLRQAVESVLDQTFANFELVIVNDASTDGSSAILDRVSDRRVIRIRNDQNQGLTRSLNAGLAHCRALLFARMDADDICEPERLRRQVELMDSEPRTAVVGCLTRHIDEDGRVFSEQRYCGEPNYLKWDLARWNPVFHPTTLMRRQVVLAAGGYDETFRYAQDYDLFTRLVMAGHELRVIEEPLLRFRESAGSITKSKRPEQAACELRARRAYVRWLLGREVSDEALVAARRLLSWEPLTPDDRPRERLRQGLALLIACRRAVWDAANLRERREIDRTLIQFLQPRAQALLKGDALNAAAVAGTLARLRGGRRHAARLLTSAARVGFGQWRRGALGRAADRS
jgi:hypothetical protein